MGFRLPRAAVPLHYNLLIEPDLEEFRFTGRVEILVEARKAERIELNSSGLHISTVRIFEGREMVEPEFELDEERERLIIRAGLNGRALLIVEFEGEISDRLVGLYRSRYGEGKWLATTQFEAPYARRMFPCFDEPDFKASFSLSVIAERGQEVVSNMPVRAEKEFRGKKLVVFEKTPPMSTYLLYLGVGDFEFLGPKGRTRVVTTPGKKERGNFALDYCNRVLEYFEDYSGVPYPLPKVDLIAVPDFGWGAMENWGAITFREVLLLHGEDTSRAIRKRILEVLAHELWHQWSGNLVTMKWWNDLWLNESFATYMAYKAVHAFHPEWKVWNDFVESELAAALSDDSLPSTQPIEARVETPQEMEQAFSPITYSKGGSVLRMLEHFMGKDAFREGISSYLKKYAYSNAEARDLWEELARHSDVPVEVIMKKWVKMPGYPLITVERRGGKLLLRQERFCHKPIDSKPWPVPLVIRTARGEVRHLMTGKEEELEVEGFIKLNSEERGVYRVKYGPGLLKEVLARAGELDEKDVWGLLNDAFNLSLVRGEPITGFLSMVERLPLEGHLLLSELYSDFFRIYIHLSPPGGFLEWSRRWFRDALNRLGWEPREGEEMEDTLTRSLAIKWLAIAGDEEVLKMAGEAFERHAAGEEMHPDLRRAVFYAVALHGGEQEWEYFRRLYSEGGPEDRVNAILALGAFRGLARRSFEFFFSEEFRPQDVRTGIRALAANANARQELAGWLREKWLRAKELGPPMIMDIIEAMISTRSTGEGLGEVMRFLKENDAGYEQVQARAFDRAERAIIWAEKNRKLIAERFR